MVRILAKILLYSIGNLLPISYYPFGKVGKLFRYLCAMYMIEAIGKNVNIEKGAVISCKIKIGDNSGIGVNCFISECTTIGNNVMMGPDCLLYTKNHKFDKEQRGYTGYTELSPITIGDNVWLGARCIILPGVVIGKGSTIGAGSVVTRSIPDYSVAVGNPARVIKTLIE